MIPKTARILTSASPQKVYRQLVSHLSTPDHLVIDGREPPNFYTQYQQTPFAGGFTKWMMLADLVTHLPDGILVKVDRASMGVSLEARVPILDHRVVEFAAGLPEHMMIRNGVTKWVLRQILQKYAPPHLTDRPKKGFGLPLGMWLKGPLSTWAQDLLDERRIRQDGYLRPEAVGRMWSEHVAGTRDWQSRLWALLSFQAWLRKWK